MKRWMVLAIAALLLIGWSRSTADFLIIRIDVSKNYFATEAPQGKDAGGVRPNAYQSFPGSGIYGPGKGGYGGGPQGGGGPGSGQFPGYGPGQFPGKEMKEMYGKYGGGGGYSGGSGTPADLGKIGPSAGGGGKENKGPNIGKGKGPNIEGMYKGGYNPGSGKLFRREEAKPRWVYAYLELHTKPRVYGSRKTGPTHIEIDHPWGKKCIVPVELVKLPYDDEKPGYIYKESMPLEYGHRMKKWVKDGKDPNRLVNLAEWALEHGLLKQFHATVAIMEKEKADTKSERAKAFLATYAKVRAELTKTPAGDDPGLSGLMTDLKKSGYRTLQSPQGHYTVLTNLPSTRNDGLQRRMSLMEETYEKFYYWFALHNQETMPPVPGQCLLAVIVADAKEFAEKQKAWGSLPLVGDGFLPRRDNVMILSAEHLDEDFALLRKNNQEMIKKWSRQALLTGSVWPEGKYRTVKGRIMPADLPQWKRDKEIMDQAGLISYMQTFVLAEKLLAIEGERATISHEATRQLLFATGMLPRNVEVPEWIQYGLSSFFETPPGSFYPGVGLPSWSNLIDFKYHRKKHLGKPKDVLLSLISDRYFLQSRESAKRLDASRFRPEHLVAKAKDDQEIARSTAWALVYYLAKEGKLQALMKYSQELDRLPRDLELSPRVLRGCFTRAFGLPDARLQEIANEWFTAMENTVLEIQEWERDFLQFRLEGSTAGRSSQAETPGGD